MADLSGTILPSLSFFKISLGLFAVEPDRLAEAIEVDESLVLAGVLLSLISIYIAAKLGSEICARINLPPVLGELIGGVAVGVSALRLLVFPSSGSDGTDSLIVQFLQATAGLSAAAIPSLFHAQAM
jgi:hypothetical protein